jgi:hypothetical protein
MVLDAEAAESVEEVDDALRQLQSLLEEQHGDIAVAIEQITEAMQKEDEHGDAEEAVENITLPFYEEDRETAFVIGITVGGLAELRENLKEEDEATDDEGSQQVEAETTQSVRLDR